MERTTEKIIGFPWEGEKKREKKEGDKRKKGGRN